MTGMELLKLMDEAGIEYMTGCRRIYKLQISDLAKLIDNYFLPRPLFEDGTPVKVEGEFARHKPSNSEKVIAYCVWDDGSFAINNFQYDQDQRVMKPEKKLDSWEQIEADEKKSGAEYWGCEGEDEHPCFGCEHSFMKTGKTCTMNKYVDLFRRAKALAGVKDE